VNFFPSGFPFELNRSAAPSLVYFPKFPPRYVSWFKAVDSLDPYRSSPGFLAQIFTPAPSWLIFFKSLCRMPPLLLPVRKKGFFSPVRSLSLFQSSAESPPKHFALFFFWLWKNRFSVLLPLIDSWCFLLVIHVSELILRSSAFCPAPRFLVRFFPGDDRPGPVWCFFEGTPSPLPSSRFWDFLSP